MHDKKLKCIIKVWKVCCLKQGNGGSCGVSETSTTRKDKYLKSFFLFEQPSFKKAYVCIILHHLF